MAIATKQIASGILATNRDAVSYVPVSQCSDWFESRYGAGTADANAMAVSVAIESQTRTFPGPDPMELMELHVFESDDLKGWTHVAKLTGPVTLEKLYAYAWEYGGARKKYLRIQFSIDLDPPHTGVVPTIPYPLRAPAEHDVEFRGTCWVTTYHKR